MSKRVARVKNKGIGKVKGAEKAKPSRKGRQRNTLAKGMIPLNIRQAGWRAEAAYWSMEASSSIDRAKALWEAAKLVMEARDHARETLTNLTDEEFGRQWGIGSPEIRYGKHILHRAGSAYSNQWVSQRRKAVKDYPVGGFTDPAKADDYRKTVNGNGSKGKGKGANPDAWKDALKSTLKRAAGKCSTFREFELLIAAYVTAVGREWAEKDAKADMSVSPPTNGKADHRIAAKAVPPVPMAV